MSDREWPQARYRFIKQGDTFCARHWCGKACCVRRCAKAPGASVHFVYAHIEKTGGSSIECATQRWHDRGWWDNMGHSKLNDIRSCESRCRGVPMKRVVSIRNPYTYWPSVYKYAWLARDSAVAQWFANRRYSVHKMRQGPLKSFGTFMKWARQHTYYTLTERLNRSCGDPCSYDALLRIETLAEDWRRLIKVHHLPKIALPQFNTATSNRTAPAPPATLTGDVVQIINQLEGRVFAQFNYTRMVV